jgi:uncharacterized protein
MGGRTATWPFRTQWRKLRNASARPDSDVDLLVIVPNSEEPGYRRDQKAYQALGWHHLPLEVIVMTRGEFDQRLPAASSLAAMVAREGRLLYAA